MIEHREESRSGPKQGNKARGHKAVTYPKQSPSGCFDVQVAKQSTNELLEV